jgi:aminopeptidase
LSLVSFLTPELDDETLNRMATIIVRCMNFKSGESTLITAGLHCWRLTEKIRLQCARKDVSSIVEMTSDEFNREYVAEIPVDFIRKLPRDIQAVAQTVDGYINLSRTWDPASTYNLAKDRLVAQREALREMEAILLKRAVRRTLVGYPTTPMAESFGVSFEELKSLIVGGMFYDQEKLLSKCVRLSRYLKGADKVHLQDGNGTDLVVGIRDRRISMSDGLISDEDQKIGYNTANLPTGEVFVAAHENLGDGTPFCPLTRDRFSNKLIRNVYLVFEKGRVSLDKSHAEEGYDELRESILTALRSDERRYAIPTTLNIAELGIGLNENIKKPIGYVLTDEKIGGSIHVAIGDNKSYGGLSESSLHWDFVTGTKEDVTVVDENGSRKKIIEEGQIIVS